jgi:hypothetical protein
LARFSRSLSREISESISSIDISFDVLASCAAAALLFFSIVAFFNLT